MSEITRFLKALASGINLNVPKLSINVKAGPPPPPPDMSVSDGVAAVLRTGRTYSHCSLGTGPDGSGTRLLSVYKTAVQPTEAHPSGESFRIIVSPNCWLKSHIHNICSQPS